MEILLFFILIVLFIHLLIYIKEKSQNFYSKNINTINFKTTCAIVLGIISIMLANGTSFFNWYKKDLMFIIIYSSLLFIVEISFPKIKNLFFLSTIPYFFIGNDIIGGLINRNHRITIFGEIVIETIIFIILLITTLIISYKRKNKINKIDFFISLVILFITLIVQFNSFNSFKKYQSGKIRLIEEKMTLEKYFNTMEKIFQYNGN
ncbi:MAG: hypothetical protein SOR11_10760 [Fusobacterium sp.]|nr:hypothetical protein [Fusobacterium sp.]